MLHLKKKVSSMDAQVLSLEAEVLLLEAEVLSLKAKVLWLKAEVLSLEAEVLSINAQGLLQSAVIEALVDEKSKECLQERAILWLSGRTIESKAEKKCIRLAQRTTPTHIKSVHKFLLDV